VRETKRLMRRARNAAVLETIGVEGGVFAQRPAEPEAQGGVQRLLPEAQARLLEVLRRRDPDRSRVHRMSLALKLVLSPLLVAQAVATRRRALVLPEAGGPREGRLGAREGRAVRVLIAGDSSAAESA
jgi:hypothetical protein